LSLSYFIKAAPFLKWCFFKCFPHASPAAFPCGLDQHACFEFVALSKVGFAYGAKEGPNCLNAGIKGAQFVWVEPAAGSDVLGNVCALLA
jgi:hypothetical protein